MNERDHELDRLLKPLTTLQPTQAQIDRWKTLARAQPRTPKYFWARGIVQMAVAACLGFLISATFFQKEVPIHQTEKKFDGFATIELVDIKSM